MTIPQDDDRAIYSKGYLERLFCFMVPISIISIYNVYTALKIKKLRNKILNENGFKDSKGINMLIIYPISILFMLFPLIFQNNLDLL